MLQWSISILQPFPKEVFLALNKPLPRAFTAILVTVLLALCLTVATQLFHQADLRSQIDDVTVKLETLRQRLAKQQREYEQAVADLPGMQADAEAAVPAAQAVYDQEQALRQQRKDLRAENATLAEEIAALQAALEQTRQESADSQSVIEHLESALNDLQSLYGLYD